MSLVRRMKAPSYRGVPVLGPRNVPDCAHGHLTPRERTRLLSQRPWQASSRSGHAWGLPRPPSGFTSAIRAVEDLQRIPSAVTTLHKRITARADSVGPQPSIPPTGLVILVENASKSRY